MKSDSSTLRPELKEKIEDWLVSFHRLDPRYKILTFFNEVAEEGADNVIESDSSEDFTETTTTSRISLLGERLSCQVRGLEILKKFAFNTTSILTVWRPCSYDSMRKMMEGSGVGKGLDIKGKSARKGILSAFVPFLQIHDEKDKKYIQEIEKKALLRVYYSSLEARELVIETLQPLASKLEEDYNDIKEEIDEQLLGHIKRIDRFKSRSWYGLELSQRLFWKGYVTNQDISRGTDTETGRPSMPGFQDANLKTLKVACSAVPKPYPMPVIIQYDPLHAMSPQHLVMAYEENGTVTPVVSDFDGFLLGWRREAIWFGCNLPREQEKLMMWCLDHIEDILENGDNSTDTWTVRWLEVLKKETMKGFHPEIPAYGFGDPKSYSIMEQAALRLIDTGAVRHGSECFNYYFPQEIDEHFLLISDTLQPVPWKYVNVEELQAILSEKIAEGFVFPLNPKWVVCDPGWKKLYDELMASDALYADLSKDVWFPPFSGVREKIDAICKKHPNGFQREPKEVAFDAKKGYSPLRACLQRGCALTGNAAFDLAELELDNYKSKRSLTKLHNLDTLLEEELEEHEEETVKKSFFKKLRERTRSGHRSKSPLRSRPRTKSSRQHDDSDNNGSRSKNGAHENGEKMKRSESPIGEPSETPVGRRSMFAKSHEEGMHLLEDRRNFSRSEF